MNITKLKDRFCWHVHVIRRGDRFQLHQKEVPTESTLLGISWLGSASHLLRASMSEVESHLGPSDFARIHRGTIVNWKKVTEMYRGFGTSSIVVLDSGRN
jgi:hypothetical protein